MAPYGSPVMSSRRVSRISRVSSSADGAARRGVAAYNADEFDGFRLRPEHRTEPVADSDLELQPLAVHRFSAGRLARSSTISATGPLLRVHVSIH